MQYSDNDAMCKSAENDALYFCTKYATMHYAKRDLMNMMVRKKNAIINKCNMSEMLQRSFAHIATFQNWGNIELQVLQGGKCILIATKQYAYKETDDIFMISWKMGIVKWQGKKRIIYYCLKHIIKCIQKALHNTK